MTYQIRKAAVLGAGVMGAAIAAHLANVGIPALLLDIVPPDAGKDRDKVARSGLEKALNARPAAFYSKRGASLVTVGNIEDDLEELVDVDWIIEAVVERLDIKHNLYVKLEQVLTPGTIISSNTSGLPAHLLTEGRSEDFRRHFLITHFFNPVRYMRLLEIVPNLYTNAADDPQREAFHLPEVVREMIRRGWLGEKSGQGFYKRIKSPDGESTILELNLDTLEYQPQQKVRFPSISEARNISDPVKRMLTILNGNDRASQLARQTTADSLIYAASLATEIADSIVAIDEAMRWGFNFELGSFEAWDALLQHPEVMQRVLQDREIPPLVRQVQVDGQGTFYIGTAGNRQYFDFHTRSYQPIPTPQGTISLEALKSQGVQTPTSGTPASGAVIRDNGSAALIDLGDGIACVEFHTKMNSIDEGIIDMLRYALEEGQKQFRAIVIGNEAADFSAGANLLLMLMGARQGEWKMLEGAINSLQQAHQLLKYSPVPVVVAPAGRALGGGCEIIMHANHARACVESYIGMVEVGVGLIPAGGGCKELLLRYGASLESQQARKTAGPFTPSRKAFEIIAAATVSTSAVEAQELRFLRKSDAITTNRDLLLRDPKADTIRLAEAREAGKWQPAQPALMILPCPCP